MATPKFERPYTAEVDDLLADIDGKRLCTAIKSRIGSVKLNDGRKAQIHLSITTKEEVFLQKPTPRCTR